MRQLKVFIHGEAFPEATLDMSKRMEDFLTASLQDATIDTVLVGSFDKAEFKLHDLSVLATDSVTALRREVEVLRQYGNKDCTAMADEVLTRERE